MESFGPESSDISIVQYEEPIPISGQSLEEYQSKMIMKAFEQGEKESKSPRASISANRPKAKQNKGTTQQLDLRETLNAILPPKRITKKQSNQKNVAVEDAWLQFISTNQLSREQVVELRKRFDETLDKKQARTTGICAMKEEIVTELFDELLRQVSLDCPERGLLLMRLRDETRLTLATYRTIYESSVAFSISKVAESDTSVKQLEQECKALENEVIQLNSERHEWLNRRKNIAKMHEDKMEQLKEERCKEIRKMTEQIQSFQEFLNQKS